MQVKFLQAYKCNISFGPWALELGPKIPVTINSTPGHFLLNKFIKGIEPPSP